MVGRRSRRNAHPKKLYQQLHWRDFTKLSQSGGRMDEPQSSEGIFGGRHLHRVCIMDFVLTIL
jgi:hypothetical protein